MKSLTTIPGSTLRFNRRMIFSETEHGTLIEDHFELDIGLPLFIQKIFKLRFRRAVKQNLLKLKELLETGHTALQDGRTTTFLILLFILI